MCQLISKQVLCCRIDLLYQEEWVPKLRLNVLRRGYVEGYWLDSSDEYLYTRDRSCSWRNPVELVAGESGERAHDVNSLLK